MSNSMRKILASFAFLGGLALAAPSFASAYFLSNGVSGNSDSNACTLSNAPCATLAGAIGKMSAGDTLYIGSHHTETIASATTWTFPGTNANPNFVFAVSDTAWPSNHQPVTADLVTPASANFPIMIVSTGSLELAGAFYSYGMEWEVTASTGPPNILVANGANIQRHESTLFFLNTSNANSILEQLGANSDLVCSNCQVEFGSTSQSISLGTSELRGNGLGTFINSSGSVPTNLISTITGNVIMDGVDLSNAGTNISNTASTIGGLLLRNVKYGTSALAAANTVYPSYAVKSENTSASATYYELHWKTYANSVDTDTSNYRTGGMTYNGTNGISYKLTGTGNSSPDYPIYSPAIVLRHLASGSSTTITLYFMFDGANSTQGFNSSTLNNNQIWMRVGYGGSSSTPINSFANNSVANLLPNTTPATQGASGGTWTTSGVTTPETYSMTVTFTPALAGDYELFVEGNWASGKIVWIDPQFTCSGNCS